MRSRRLLPVLLLVLAALGAVGYGIGFAWPARYARRVLAFERDVKQGPRPSEALAARLSRNDPTATRELLTVQAAFVNRLVAGARDLRPAPPQYWQLQRDIERGTELLRLGHENVVQTLDFQDRSRALYDLIRAGLVAPRQPLTVGAFLAHLDQQLPKIVAAGDALFAGEPVPLRNPTYEELRSSWNDGRRGLEVLVGALRREVPTRPFAEVTRRPQTGPEAEAERALERFTAVLQNIAERAITPDSVLGLLAESQHAQEFQEISSRLTPALEALKQRYAGDARR